MKIYTVFEIQPPDSLRYASPYVEFNDGMKKEVSDVVDRIFKFLNSRDINFVVKEGRDLRILTSNTIMKYDDFFRVYDKGS